MMRAEYRGGHKLPVFVFLNEDQVCQLTTDQAMKCGLDLLAAATAALGGWLSLPMVLHCPKCNHQHIDAADTECPPACHALPVDPAGCHGHEAVCVRWKNPPHKSHLCHNCGTIWRPAMVPTIGVAGIEQRGDEDTWP